MKGYILILSLIYLGYNVSADWKDDLAHQYISNVEHHITVRKEDLEAMQRRRGVGEGCIVTLHRQLEKTADPFKTKIQNCVSGDANQADAKRCCEQEQTLIGITVDHILDEAMECIETIIMNYPQHN